MTALVVFAVELFAGLLLVGVVASAAVVGVLHLADDLVQRRRR